MLKRRCGIIPWSGMSGPGNTRLRGISTSGLSRQSFYLWTLFLPQALVYGAQQRQRHTHEGWWFMLCWLRHDADFFLRSRRANVTSMSCRCFPRRRCW